uniref:Putative ovule protein n=1 Tax=Solanum chacoense TaxID=4108 RepID=A0A0V0HG20_SOLCH
MIYQYTHTHSSMFSSQGVLFGEYVSHVRSLSLILISFFSAKMSSQAWSGSSHRLSDSDARRAYCVLKLMAILY